MVTQPIQPQWTTFLSAQSKDLPLPYSLQGNQPPQLTLRFQLSAQHVYQDHQELSRQDYSYRAEAWQKT